MILSRIKLEAAFNPLKDHFIAIYLIAGWRTLLCLSPPFYFSYKQHDTVMIFSGVLVADDFF